GVSVGAGEASPAGWPVISAGVGSDPRCTVAATRAIANGLVNTVPWPIASAARSAPSLAGGTLPPNTGTGNFQSAPTPNRAAVSASAPSVNFADRLVKVVLQERANAVRSGTVPRSNWLKLMNRLLATTIEPGHG